MRAEKVVKAPASPGEPPKAAPALTRLSSTDQLRATTAFGGALFFRGAGALDAAALERALELTLADLPLLAGRLTPPSGARGSLSEVHIKHSNQGAVLVEEELPSLSLADVSPDSWPVQRFNISNPPLPICAEGMDAMAVLGGRAPLLRVRLTRLADGDVLAVMMSHVITDGMRYPALLAHLAARYRQASAELAGAQADAPAGAGAPNVLRPLGAQLLVPGDRSVLSLQSMLKALSERGGPKGWQPQPLRIAAGLADYLRLGWQKLLEVLLPVDLLILHVPQPRLEALLDKARAAQAAGERCVDAEAGGSRLTAGDAAQALGGLLVHAASGRPLVPSGGKHMAVLVQNPCAKALSMGNAMVLLQVSAPEGTTPATLPREPLPAFTKLAQLVRRATAAFRANPEQAVQAVAHDEEMCRAPLVRLVGWLSGRHLPTLASCTNYVGALPEEQALDFGSGLPAFQRWLFSPMAKEMCIIRPAQLAAERGLFFHLCLTRRQQRALQRSGVLAALAPDARWLGRRAEAGA